MNLASTAQCLLHKIDVLNHAGIDGNDFSRVMTAENMIQIVQGGQIVLALLVTIPNPQAFVGMHVIKGQLTFWKDLILGARMRKGKEPSAQEKHPGH